VGRSNVETKVFELSDLKLDGDGAGTFEAVFATMDAIDHDGDTYDKGAIGTQDVVISQWNHGSWEGGAAALPIGVGKIFERENKAIVKGEFDMEDPDGKKTYDKLKYLRSKGMNVEWSFALPHFDVRWEQIDGDNVRVFTSIDVPEVSPVLLGAGVGTELLSIKNASSTTALPVTVETSDDKPSEERKQFVDQLEEAVVAVESVVARAKEIKNLRNEKGKDLSRAAVRRLKTLADALHDASEDVGELLIDPNVEARAIAEKWRKTYAKTAG
jgi:hypothetical protein